MGLVSGVRRELRLGPDHRWVDLDYFAQAGQVPLETRHYQGSVRASTLLARHIIPLCELSLRCRIRRSHRKDLQARPIFAADHPGPEARFFHIAPDRQSSTQKLNVITSEGFAAAYDELVPVFQKSSGITVSTRHFASQGNGPDTIPAQLCAGAAADVVIMGTSGHLGLRSSNLPRAFLMSGQLFPTQSKRACVGASRLLPSPVNSYSTRGGTSGKSSRVISPSRSKFRRVSVSILCEIDDITFSSSEKRARQPGI
jgi:nucleotide-binding universal stress UspA family protein